MSDITDDKIERIARAMAVADGIDPDKMIWCNCDDTWTRRVDFSGANMSVRVEAWVTYGRRANLFLAAMGALEAGDE